MQERFIEKIGNVLDRTAINTNPADLKQMVDANRSFSPAAEPFVILYPETVEEVQAIVKTALEEEINLVPTSSADGALKLTGESLPAEGTESAIVNLNRMKKIIRIDRRNKMAIVEAGVTYKELNEAAAEYGMRIDHPFQIRDTKSIVASLLDREPTMVPRNQWDVNDPLSCMECVMGTGEVFRTGSAAGPGTLEEQWASGVAQNNPLGPGWLDLGRVLSGSQGTLAIVTWASVRMQLIPEKSKLLFAQSDDIKELEPFVYGAIRRRLGDEYVILNSFALAAMVKNLKGEIETLSDQLPQWTVITRVAGYNYCTDLRFDQQETDTKELGQKLGIAVTDEIARVTNRSVGGLLDDPVKGITWKTRYAGQGINLYFLSTLDKAQTFVDIVKTEMEKHGFDPEILGILLQPVQMSRSCHIEFVIPYRDREAAEKLYQDLTTALIEAGAFFNRPFGPMVEAVFAKTPAQRKSSGKIKELFDPKRILNQGKLYYEEA